jgi:hypothetical protein
MTELGLYLVIAVIAFGLIGLGYYCFSVGGVSSMILGIFFWLSGFLPGIVFFGDRWDPF